MIHSSALNKNRKGPCCVASVRGQVRLFNTVYEGFFTPLIFHEFHKLFWIREINFIKCCGNVIAVLVAILKFLVKNA